MNTDKYKKALTIAGSDSGGGAGIQADIKTFQNLGVYGMSAITAVTAQNTLGVQGIFEVPPEFVELQIRSVLSDIGADAAKTGMLSNSFVIKAVSGVLKEYNVKNLVIDPVMISTSGDHLLEKEAVQALKEILIPLACIITPNLDEAEVLLDTQVRNIEEMKSAAEKIQKMGALNVLVKGGHLEGEMATDIFFDGKGFTKLESSFIPAKHTHGTGCTLSSAICAYLACGNSPINAVKKAKIYITNAIRFSLASGGGRGPVNHHWGVGSGPQYGSDI
jgi:hydroxymethylpyrimidine/phosphomethylpyrimidine kinase